MVGFGKGTITIAGADGGKSSNVTWVEEMDTVGIVHKWFAWFGVQQKTQSQQIDASFTQLRAELESQ